MATTIEYLTRQLRDYMANNELSVRRSFDVVEKEIEALRQRNATREASSASASHALKLLKRAPEIEEVEEKMAGRRRA